VREVRKHRRGQQAFESCDFDIVLARG